MINDDLKTKDSSDAAGGAYTVKRFVMCDEPIREGVHEKSLCKFCIRILQDCRHVHKLAKLRDGYKVVVDCIGFNDCRKIILCPECDSNYIDLLGSYYDEKTDKEIAEYVCTNCHHIF